MTPALVRRSCAILVIGCAAIGLAASSSSGDLQNQIGSLRSGVQSDTKQIQQYQGRLSDIEVRLAQIQASVATEQSVLSATRSQLHHAQTRLVSLRERYQADRVILATQLVAQYESPSPDIVDVVIESHGFNDMLERISDMKRVAQGNAQTTKLVAGERDAVASQILRLAADEARQKLVNSAVLAERGQVDQLRLSVLGRELEASHARARTLAQLRPLEHQLAAAQALAATAARQSATVTAPAGAGYNGAAFVLSTGTSGFFPAPGTDYSVGEEPELAARLNQLAQALGIHLIGISGYRSPEHSVEVGGFANDPHTLGEASDTPGIEGVPEATLEQFGLTRPFSGAAEADHIQLLGS